MKIESDDGHRWFRDAFDGFARPIEMAWLLFCQHLAIMFWTVVGAIPCLACALAMSLVCYDGHLGAADALPTTVAVVMTMAVGMAFAVMAVYRYRLAWLLKVEDPGRSAVSCIVASRRMMRGYKLKAMLIDLAFVWRIALAFAASAVIAFSAMALNDVGGVAAMIALAIILAAFLVLYYLLCRIGTAMSVAHVVLYREILAEGAS